MQIRFSREDIDGQPGGIFTVARGLEKKAHFNGFGGVKNIIIIPAIFIFRPYRTHEIIGNGVAINTHVPLGTTYS